MAGRPAEPTTVGVAGGKGAPGRVRPVDVALFALVLVLTIWWSSGLRNALVWLACAGLLALPSARPIPLRESLPLGLAIALLGWTLLGVPFSEHPMLSARDWVKTAECIVAGWVIAQLLAPGARLERILWYLLLALTVVYTWNLGWFVAHAGEAWAWSERWHEPLHFNHPNIFAGLIAIALPLALLPFLDPAAGAWRRTVAVANLVTGLVLLHLFASRTAQVTVLALLALLAALRGRPWQRRAALVTLVGIVLATPFVNPRFRDPTMWTMTNRVENWIGTARLATERPWLGHGFGNRNYKAVYGARYPDRSEPFPHAHNVFLKLAFESGLIGLALFVALQLSLLGGLWTRARRGRPPDRGPALVLGLSLVALLVYGLAEVPELVLRLYTWVLVGLAAVVCARPLPFGRAER